MSRPSDPKFLNRYFRSIYNKLEADALLFNRRLPHEGLKGSANEKALTEVIRDFLPSRYGVEDNALIIDRHGQSSRQCDIVIFDDTRVPKYFKKVHPIETVHAVIEVKTELTKQKTDEALENEAALRRLDFYPELAPYWRTRTETEGIAHAPPVHSIFGYRTDTKDFGTFLSWFSALPSSNSAHQLPPGNPFITCALDKGLIYCRGDGHILRLMAVAAEPDGERNFEALGDRQQFQVDPAKALFLFLETLWSMLWQSPRHPGFDIRSYMDRDLGLLVPFDYAGRLESKLR